MPTVESSCALVTPIFTATPMPCMISAASGPTCTTKQGKQQPNRFGPRTAPACAVGQRGAVPADCPTTYLARCTFAECASHTADHVTHHVAAHHHVGVRRHQQLHERPARVAAAHRGLEREVGRVREGSTRTVGTPNKKNRGISCTAQHAARMRTCIRCCLNGNRWRPPTRWCCACMRASTCLQSAAEAA